MMLSVYFFGLVVARCRVFGGSISSCVANDDRHTDVTLSTDFKGAIVAKCAA